MKYFIYLIIGLLVVAGIRAYIRKQDEKIIDEFNKNAERIYADVCLFSTKLIEDIKNKKKHLIDIQYADFSKLESHSIIGIQNRLPPKQFYTFAERMGIKVEEGEDELFFMLDKVYVSQYMIEKGCVIWQWEMAN